jgi:hypothetical protein
MALIELTSEERNGKAYAKTILLNTDTIAVPIREVGGKSYIGVNESIVSGRPSENLDIVYYLVTEDIATVVALSYDLFGATVITRDGRTPSTGYNDLIFRLDRVVGNIAAEGTGSKFMYHEDNGTVPIEFVVAEAPSAIISQVVPPTPISVENPILKTTFVLDGSVIETLGAGYNMIIDADINAVCVPIAILFDYELNGGTGTVWDTAPTKLRISSTTGNFAIADGQNFEVTDNLNRSFRLYDENGFAYGTAQLWTNSYEIDTETVITSSDPLTTLTIDFYYILK